MHLIDIAVIVMYLLGITFLGIRIGKRIKASSDFFMPRRFGKGMMMMHAFGTGTASDQAVIVSSASFKNGLSGIWFQWLWLFCTPFYWVIAPIFRRLRAITTADVYALRVGSSVAVLFSIIGVIGLSLKIGLMLKGAGALIDAGTDGSVSSNFAIPVVALLFVIYGAAGGMSAAIVTDYIQGILTIIFSFILLPFVLHAVGGIDGVRGLVNDSSKMSLVAPDKIGIFFIVAFGVNSLFLIVSQPFIMGVCAAGKTEMDGRFGFVVGNLIKRVCTAAWAITGLAALAYFIKEGTNMSQIDPDRVYGQMAKEFLPVIFPGLLGLFIAALLAGVMSSCDSFMISSSALFTENLYKPIREGKSKSHYLKVARAASIMIVGFGLIFAFSMDGVVSGLKSWLKFGAPLGIGFWAGLFWRRFNAAGVWVSTLTAYFCWWMTTQSFFISFLKSLPFEEKLGILRSAKGSQVVYEPWQIVFYLSVAIVAGVLASLFTKSPDEKKIKRYHDLISTPVREGEIIDEPCTLPVGTLPAKRRKWFAGTSFEICAPSRVSYIGFALSWAAVAIMIFGFMYIMRP
ncbi:MAG: sodium:solute symporter family protein [Verrucomicrobiota bacterium]|nr:sodium:solute symporter family protein [Verrucomicrobiota bacterium]